MENSTAQCGENSQQRRLVTLKATNFLVFEMPKVMHMLTYLAIIQCTHCSIIMYTINT